MNYNLGPDTESEDFFMAEPEQGKSRSVPKGADILLSVPTSVWRKKNMTLLGLIDTGLSEYLFSKITINLRYKKKRTTKSTE